MKLRLKALKLKKPNLVRLSEYIDYNRGVLSDNLPDIKKSFIPLKLQYINSETLQTLREALMAYNLFVTPTKTLPVGYVEPIDCLECIGSLTKAKIINYSLQYILDTMTALENHQVSLRLSRKKTMLSKRRNGHNYSHLSSWRSKKSIELMNAYIAILQKRT